MVDRINLDNISQTKPLDSALFAMMPFFQEYYGSPNAPHKMGQELLSHINASFASIYRLFGAAADDQFLFASSGQEAVATVVNTGFCERTIKKGYNHFVARANDAAPFALSVTEREEEGCILRLIACNKRGFVSKEALFEAISPRTALISISWASPLTGVIQPLEEIYEVCQQRAIWLHVDATHVVGKQQVNFQEMPCDFLSFNGVQIHAPSGTGGLFAKKGIALHPVIPHAPLNVPLLVALGQAAEAALDTQTLYCTEVVRLRDLLESRLKELLPETVALFTDEERLPYCSSMAFPMIYNELLAYVLQRKGIFCSLGGGLLQPIESELTLCGMDPELARSALSFSLSKDTQEAEIERAASIIGEVANRQKKLSKTIFSK
jgi:cysteine desulfurase